MLNRREILKGAAASLLLGPGGCSIFGGEGGGKDLFTRQEHPFNAEPRLDRLVESWITPFSRFYVRSHGEIPDIDGAGYTLVIEGLVNETVRLSLEELRKLPKVKVPATLQCAGNRRSEHSAVKPVAGVAWDAGAIGTAEWRGVRLSELLQKAGLKPSAKHVWFDGLDTVTMKDRQTLFGGGVPLEKALRPETIVALEMNGEPLSREHGYPARTVVPGYIGARSVKWLGRIVVADRSSDNNFVARDYKLFPPEAAPETVKPADFEPIYENVLSSAICRPLAGQTLKAGRIQVSGYAVPPGAPGVAVAGVEVSADGGATWVSARLDPKEAPFAWKLWTVEVDAAAGARTLVARAKDTKGGMQPERAPWNFKGYLCNGWHRVPVTVA
jgi:sulfite oxidase